jgi:hypothetical protein
MGAHLTSETFSGVSAPIFFMQGFELEI